MPKQMRFGAKLPLRASGEIMSGSASPILKPLPLVMAWAAGFLLCGCIAPSPDPFLQGASPDAAQVTEAPFSFNTPGLFTGTEAIATPTDLHTLTPAQLADFRAWMEDPDAHRVPRHQRLFDYLQKITHEFTYYGATTSASNALLQRNGNCMSLAVLTTALAEAAGIEIGYQLMEDTPVFEYEGSLVVKGVHLRTILYDPAWTPPVFKSLLLVRSGLQVDYFPSARERFVANVSRERYLAMFYQNVAVEALEAGDIDKAYHHALAALDYDPDSAPAINTLAIAHRRAGALDRAEALYLHGIAHADDKLSLLKNYQALLLFKGRTEEARDIANRLEAMDDPSPYNWLHLAQSAERDSDFAAAARYYRRAIEKAPYLHEAHLGLALAHYQQGKFSDAKLAMQDAVDKVVKPATRRLYETKLHLLEQQMAN
jgi:Tfp pilus assembly protein PilF